MLREVQEACGWIPPAAIDCLEAAMRLPRNKIEGVASFYAFLHTKPAGRYRVRFSNNITDRMLGSRALIDRLCRSLWVERGKVSEDGLVGVDTTSCTGLCDQGPALLVNEGHAIGRLTEARIDEVAELIRGEVPVAGWPAELFRVDNNIRRRELLLAEPPAPGTAIDAALARGPGAMLDEVKASKLRGRGGAGFLTGRKGDAYRRVPGRTRFVVCNADEGEPGNFKDRVLLATRADLAIEGMTVAAFVVGARRGFIYLRAEYRFLLPALEAALSRRR